jgi:hypothetical protein
MGTVSADAAAKPVDTLTPRPGWFFGVPGCACRDVTSPLSLSDGIFHTFFGTCWAVFALAGSSESCFYAAMKHSLTGLTLVAVVARILFGGIICKADAITLSVAPVNHTGNCRSFSVPTNVVAQIISACCKPVVNAYIMISITDTTTTSNVTAYYSGSATGTVADLPITVVGPATISLCSTNNAGGQMLSFCTIQTSPSYALMPSCSVVIPNDAGGPVNVILESSTDLINWTAANPGTYGTTSSNRFFRVRAQR